MAYLHTLLCLALILCGLYVAFSHNPVESVVFLILSFLNAGVILVLFNIEFFGLIFIMVYVGAVSVLFLFVVMMLNIKKDPKLDPNYYPLQIVKALAAFSAIVFLIWLTNYIFGAKKTGLNFNHHDTSYDYISNIDLLGQVLYNNYLICFLVAGLILLIALVGSVTLTLRYNVAKKSQLYTRQIARTDNFLSFFK